MVVRREANAKWVAVAPRERLDRLLGMGGIDARAEHGACAHAGLGGVFERGYSGAGPLHAVVRVPAGHVAIARGPEAVAELDVLAGDVVLVATAAVVVAGDTRVARSALRPVHETVLHLQH